MCVMQPTGEIWAARPSSPACLPAAACGMVPAWRQAAGARGMGGGEWWRGAVIYQIYPRSFFDSDGDGVGDLPGITGRLGHVATLGVDGIWLSPFFTSPMKDFGYDVADYRDVDPLFGRLADFDALLAEAHRLGLKVIIDQVYSHSSDRHPWFLGKPAEPRQPQGRLVRLGRSQAGRQPAQQLARGLRRRRLGVGAAQAAVLPAQLPQGAAGPQPAQPARSAGGAGRGPLLARPRGGRLPPRRRQLLHARPGAQG